MQIPNTTTPADPQSLPTVHSDSTYSVFSNPLALLQLILSHWWVLVGCLFLCSLFGGIYAYLATPIYRATARIEILNDSRVETRATTQYDRQERSLSRQILLLKSARLHQQVRTALAEKWKSKLTAPELYVEFSVSSVSGSNGSMIDLIVDSVDPKYSEAYLIEMIEGYRSLRIQELMEVNDSALSGLKSEEVRVQEDLEQAKLVLERFESENKIFFEQERAEMDLDFVNQLLSRLKSVRMERVLLEHQYEQIAGADALTIKETLSATRQAEIRSQLSDEVDAGPQGNGLAAENSVSGAASMVNLYENFEIDGKWADAQTKLVELQNQAERLGTVFKDKHPRMVELRQQIDDARNAVVNQNELSRKRFKARYEALKLQEASIELVIEDWQLDQGLSLLEQSEYRQLRSKVSHLEKKYDLVYGRLLENTQTSASFFLRKIQEPRANMRPIKPQVFKILAASFISTRKVLSPPARLSLAPTRVNSRSTTPIFADLAGIKLPICAINTISPTCRK